MTAMSERREYTMKIQWIEFQNLKTGLIIERVNFNEDITLLVGLSGAGKTQILNAIEYSLSLASGKENRLSPCLVSIGVKIGKDEYEWTYKIAEVKNGMLFDGEEKYEFTYEKLKCGESVLFERSQEHVNVIGYDKVPQPKKDESLLVQYSENKEFQTLISGMRRFYSIETEIAVRAGVRSENFNMMKAKAAGMLGRETKIPFEVFSKLPTSLKIYITKRYYPDLYGAILDAIQHMFAEVEDIDVEEDTITETYLVTINVYGKKLIQQDISNGMLKAIYYVVELFTMSKDSLVLIDEFENGLGVNCIDWLSELILDVRKDLQFIITSHHPKIINEIEKEKWKIIDRTVCTVKNYSSDDYGIGNSQHDAYFNLVNRWEYEGKI